MSKIGDIDAKDNGGKIALSYNVDGGYTEIAEILRKHGAKEWRAKLPQTEAIEE